MQTSDFTKESPGALLPIGEGLQAFVPAALPEELSLPVELVIKATRAEKAIGRLGGMLIGGGNPLSPHLVGRPLQRREAIESSRIEGTFTTPEQLVLLDSEEDGDEPTDTSDTREVHNYMVALDWGAAQLGTLPISQRLIRGIHQRLMEGVRGGDKRPGEFRTTQNFIGRTQDPHEARFVPPPWEQVPELLADLERYIHVPAAEQRSVRLIRLALIHYQFETIHPFLDGNGRVGRILIPLLLQSDDEADPPLFLSAYFERHRQRYYDLLLAVSQKGSYGAWIEFFLDGVIDSATSSIELANTLLQLRKKYRDVAQKERWPAAMMHLIDHLFDSPVLSSKRVEQLAQVSTPTASTYLKKLEDAGIVREYTRRTRNRRYLAFELLAAVHDST